MNCKTVNRKKDRLLLAALLVWILLTLYFAMHHQCREFKYSRYVFIHMRSGHMEHLKLTSSVENSRNSRDPLQVPGTKEDIKCDFSHFRTDICELNGDVRVGGPRTGTNGTVGLVAASDKLVGKIKPYTRKWEESCMKTIGEVEVRTLGGPSRMHCHVNHSVPAVVFSTGGYTGNVYHEFNDGLIPLFLTSRRYNREVTFVILEMHKWWMMKYGSVVRLLSSYDPVDFDRDQKVHCFPQVKVGLEIHGELSIDPGSAVSMHGFQHLLKSSFSTTPGELTEMAPVRKPKLVLLTRKRSRVLINRNDVIRLARRIGFDVVILTPDSRSDLAEVHRELHTAEVFVGIHGAGLTHLLFLRPGSVFIQIVPLGTDWAAQTYYGEPAVKAGLEYIAYKILPEESSLIHKFGRNHTAVEHPEKITSQGWWEMKKIYLEDQHVKVSLARFKPVLERAFRHTSTNIDLHSKGKGKRSERVV